MIRRWNDHENDRTLEKLFRNNYNNITEEQKVGAYADLFGLSLSSNTWEQLKNADISKLTTTKTS